MRVPLVIRALVLSGIVSGLFAGISQTTLAEDGPNPPTDLLLVSIPNDHLQPLTLKGTPARGGYNILIAADGTNAAYIARKDDKHFVVLGKDKGPDLEGEIMNLRLSPDGKSVIYTLLTAERRVPYVNHKPVTEDGASVKIVAGRELFILSPDGKRFAAVMQSADKDYIILDGQRSADYPFNTLFIPYFSPDSRHFSHVVNLAGAFEIIIDGNSTPLTGYASRPVYSRDGAHVTFTVGSQVFLDGNVFATVEGVNSPSFSPDGKSLAFVGNDGDQRVVYVNDRKGPPFDIVYGADGLHFSPDSQRIAYYAKRDNKFVVVVDDKVSMPFDFASEITFSPDSRRFAFKGRLGDKEVLVDNNEQLTFFDKIATGSITFSPDSKNLVCSATRAGKNFIFTNGAAGTEYDENLYNPVYSPDGSKIAYSVNIQKDGVNRGFIVVNGEPGPEFIGVSSPVFSPDSKHLAYAASTKEGKQFCVLDHIPGPPTGSAQSANFTPDSQHVTYIAIDGRDIWRKVLEVPK